MVATGNREETETSRNARVASVVLHIKHEMRMSKRRRTMKWSYKTIVDAPRDSFGIYAIWCRHNGKCIYVGEASKRSIGERLGDHWRKSHNQTLQLWIRAFGSDLDLCYASVEKPRIAVAERRLIRLWNPEANVQHKR